MNSRQQQSQRRCLYALSGLWIGLAAAPFAVGTHGLRAESLQAIVQLKGLGVSPPTVRGASTLPLKELEDTQVFTTQVTLGQRSERFLIDTGASTSLLSAEVVKGLQLKGKTVPAERLASAVAGRECSSMGAGLYLLPPFLLQTAQVSGLSGLKFDKTVIPAGLSGALGMDVLSRFDLQLDPTAQTLKLSSPSVLPPALSDQAVPLQGKLGVFLAKLTLNGQGPFTMLLDTGADGTFISEAVAQRLKIDPKARESIQVQGFCGLEPASRAPLASVRLYQYEQTKLLAVILSSPVLKLLGVDGILGQNFLAHYRQHWRFTPAVVRNAKADGSLLLSTPSAE